MRFGWGWRGGCRFDDVGLHICITGAMLEVCMWMNGIEDYLVPQRRHVSYSKVIIIMN